MYVYFIVPCVILEYLNKFLFRKMRFSIHCFLSLF